MPPPPLQLAGPVQEVHSSQSQPLLEAKQEPSVGVTAFGAPAVPTLGVLPPPALGVPPSGVPALGVPAFGL